MSTLQSKSVKAIVLLSLALINVSSPGEAHAAIINFDSISALGAGGNGVGGATLNDYLNGFGLSLTGITAGTQVIVLDVRNIYPGLEPVIAPSPFNVIAQSGSNFAVSYTLQSSQLLNSVSFTRPAIRSGATGIALPQWSVDILNPQSSVIGTVGESSRSIFSDVTSQTFTLNGPDISAIRVNANGFNFAALGSMPLDNFNITAVPEPCSFASIGVLSLFCIGNCMLRRRRITSC